MEIRIGKYSFNFGKAHEERASTKMPLNSIGQPTNIFSSISDAGNTVTQQTALRLSAVYATVRNISEDVAKLPIGVFKQDPDGDKHELSIEESKVAYLLKVRPMRGLIPFDLISSLLSQAILKGNAYAYIIRDEYYQPAGLKLVAPESVTIWVSQDDTITYQVLGNNFLGYWMEEGFYSSDDIIHLKGISLDSIAGIPLLVYLSNVYGGAMASQDFANSFYKNGTNLGGTLTVEGTLDEPAYKRLSDSIRNWAGARNSGHTPILEGGTKYNPITINAEQAQVLDSRKYSVIEIARVLRIPLHKIQDLDHATFSNIEEQNIDYIVDTLQPWITKIEMEFKSKLLTEAQQKDHYININVSELLRGNQQARAAFWHTLLTDGVVSINEVRSAENLNRVEGGDSLYKPLNMAIIGEDGQLIPPPRVESTNTTDPTKTPEPKAATKN